MIGEVEHGGLVGDAAVIDHEGVVAPHRIGDGDIAGQASGAVGILDGEFKAGLAPVMHRRVPHPFLKSDGAGMKNQTAAAAAAQGRGRLGDGLAVQLETLGQAIGQSAVDPTLLVLRKAVITQHDIAQHAFAVGRHQATTPPKLLISTTRPPYTSFEGEELDLLSL